MSNPKNDLNSTEKESKKLPEEYTNKDLEEKNKSEHKKYIKKENVNKSLHLNSLITKNVSLFTTNPNYKMLTWLIVQLIIFSLFVLAVNIFKNNLIPYFNA